MLKKSKNYGDYKLFTKSPFKLWSKKNIDMKKIKTIALAIAASGILFAQDVQAQNFGDLLNSVFGNGTTNQNKNSGLGAGLSNAEITNGLKEALTLGAQNASKRLSIQDGFFKNAAVKILMPPEARKVEQTLRQFGLGHLANQAILLMNRAAEDAASKAAPIFVNAITSMTLNDALGILRGGNTAATDFLRSRTQAELIKAFTPVIRQSLDKVGANKAWEAAFTAYNKLPLVTKVNPNLTEYVAQKATEGMFITIADEERKIRENPMGQASSLLRKVFGGR